MKINEEREEEQCGYYEKRGSPDERRGRMKPRFRVQMPLNV
jgi:hypothetical protein